MNTKLIINILVFTLLSLAGVASYAEDDYVKIVSLTPSNAKPLYVGSKVNISVEVEYAFQSANIASITMVVQKAESGGRPLANETDVVLKGKGTLKLSKEITIPETKAIRVFTPLSPEGSNSTTTVDSRMFKVVKK